MLRIPLTASNSSYTFQGFDLNGHLLSSAIANATLTYTGVLPDPQNMVVFNEIMYNPLVPGATYVEIFNTSSDFSFDLSNWRIKGLGFTFPPGSLITNHQYVAIVQNRSI